MGKTFYETETPEEAIKIYLKVTESLYDKTKEKVIKRILSSIPSLDSLKVLEVGAGGGIYTEFFVKQGADVTCVDLCEQILKGNAKLHPEAKCILADATTVTLKEKFDLIFAKDVIEHIEDDLLFLKNMKKHLKTDGTLLIITQNAFSLNYLIEGGFNFLRGNRKWCGWDSTHVRFYTPWTLKRKCQSVGLKVYSTSSLYHIPYRVITGFIFGKVYEHNIFHLSDKVYDKFPVKYIGWSLICEIKQDKT